MNWSILLSIPIAVVCERLLDPDARRTIRAWMRRRRINRLPLAPEPLTPQMREHWERVLTQALDGHEVQTQRQNPGHAADHWAAATRAQAALRRGRR